MSYKVVNSSGEFFTMKRILILSEEIDDQRQKHRIMHDMCLATSLNHPNVMKCLGVCKNEYGIYFLYDFMPLSLCDVSTRDEPRLAKIAYQVLKGLKYLREEKDIVFKHLTSRNIMCDASGDLVKIEDVGVVKDKYITLDRVCIAISYMKYIAPENFHFDSDVDDLQLEKYSKCDVWSLGLCLLHCYYGTYPFDEDFGNLRRYVLAGMDSNFDCSELERCDVWPPRPPADAPRLFREFISSCLKLDVSERAGVVELLTHHGFITSNCFCHGLDNANCATVSEQGDTSSFAGK